MLSFTGNNTVMRNSGIIAAIVVILALAVFFSSKYKPPAAREGGGKPRIISGRAAAIADAEGSVAVGDVSGLTISSTEADNLSPFDPAKEDLLWRVGGKTSDQVRQIVGEPRASYEMSDRVCWYYQIELPGLDGSVVNPEIQFLADQANFVIRWPPETMVDKIATARLNNGREPPAVERDSRYQLQEFYALVSDKSRDGILNSVGAPDKKRIMQGQEIWQYDKIAEESGNLYTFAIRFDDYRAVEVGAMVAP